MITLCETCMIQYNNTTVSYCPICHGGKNKKKFYLSKENSKKMSLHHQIREFKYKEIGKMKHITNSYRNSQYYKQAHNHL